MRREQAEAYHLGRAYPPQLAANASSLSKQIGRRATVVGAVPVGRAANAKDADRENAWLVVNVVNGGRHATAGIIRR
jgi:hypothetical protein